MTSKKQLTIMEFSRLTGIKRENLRFYDRINLLSPEMRGNNNYRYYSKHQLNTAYLISSLRGLGVSIDDIKKYSLDPSPEKSLELVAQQDARIKAEIRHLQETRKIMKLHSEMVKAALSHNKNDFFLEEKPQEPIFLCPPIPKHMDDDEGGIFSYQYAEEKGINLGFPQGVIISHDDLINGNTSNVGRYYFKDSIKANGYKPNGLFAVMYAMCDPWKSEHIYEKMLKLIKSQNLHICGDAYEECPISDLSVRETSQYCMRIEIPVSKKII